jgi:hypothetical protein
MIYQVASVSGLRFEYGLAGARRESQISGQTPSLNSEFRKGDDPMKKLFNKRPAKAILIGFALFACGAPAMLNGDQDSQHSSTATPVAQVSGADRIQTDASPAPASLSQTHPSLWTRIVRKAGTLIMVLTGHVPVSLKK